MKVTDLPDGVLTNCLSFLGDGNFLFVALVCRSFCDRYKSYLRTENEQPKPTMTSLEEIVASVSRLLLAMKELNIGMNNDNETKMRWRGEAVDIWDAVISCTSYNGNMDVLVWIKNNNRSKWEEQCHNVRNGNYYFNVMPCVEAAKGGQLEVLQWLHQNGSPSNVHTCRAAAEDGHFEILKWLHQNGCPWDEQTCDAAARSGRFDILIWLRENGCPWDEGTCSDAARNGHLDILQWAYENGCPWNEWTCSSAAEGGHFELLKWLRENGCPWNEWTCTSAAEVGHFGMLRWLRKNRCPWNSETLEVAKENGYLEIFEWAIANGCPLEDDDDESVEF